MLLQLRLLLRKAVADSVDAANATVYHHQHHHHYKLVIIIVIITLSCLLKVIKTTDDKFNSLPFLIKSTKSLLYRSEKSIICAVFVTFVVFDRLSVANFPSVVHWVFTCLILKHCLAYTLLAVPQYAYSAEPSECDQRPLVKIIINRLLQSIEVSWFKSNWRVAA